MGMRLFLRSPLVISIAVVAGLSACSDSSSISRTVEVAIDQPKPEFSQNAYIYHFLFEDALTGALITDELQVQVTGPAASADLVVGANNTSVKGRTLTTAVGTLSLAANYTLANPRFSISVANSAKGWTPTGVELTQAGSVTGSQTVVVKLIKPSQAPVINANADLAVAAVNQTLTVPANGSLTTNLITLTTPQKQANSAEGRLESVGAASVVLPVGVTALDSNGQKIKLSGNVAVSVVKFANNSAPALAAFPGGFVATARTETGTIETNKAFVTAGFAQFNVTDEKGARLQRFDQPLRLSIDLPKSTTRLDGKVLVAGDTYPIWRYDEVSGVWQFVANGVIREKTPLDAGYFEVSFESDTLNTFALGQLSTTCTGTLRLTRSAQDTRPLTVELLGQTGLRFSRSFYRVAGSTQTVDRYPVDTRVNVTVRNADNTVLTRAATAQNLCTGGVVEVPAPVIEPINARSTLVVNITESCPSGTNRRPSPTFVAFDGGTGVLSGYARTNTAGTQAELSLAGIASATQGTLKVFNPITQRYVSQTVKVNPPTTTVAINFADLKCGAITGASGSGN